MSVDYTQVLRSVSGSRKTQYLISIWHDTAYFPYFFLVKQVYLHKRNRVHAVMRLVFYINSVLNYIYLIFIQ